MTTSYARHKASDKLYEDLDTQIDKFVEVYIGKYGRPKLSPNDLKFALTVHSDTAINDFLEKCIAYLMKDIYIYLKETDVDLITIRDDMVAAMNQTKYLFTLK